MKRTCFYAAVLSVMMIFISCVIKTIGYPPRTEVVSKDALPEDKVIVVGKVLFDPPMPMTKQDLRSVWPYLYRNKMWLICKNELKGLDNPNGLFPTSPDFKGRIEAYLGDTFYVMSEKVPFYILAGSIYMKVYDKGDNEFYGATLYPGSFYINIKPEDRAVYIGTIKYHRDNFYNCVKVEIVDEYNYEMPEFRHRFGAMKLRKALIRQPREDALFKIGTPY